MEDSGMAHYESEHLGAMISDLLHSDLYRVEAHFGCLVDPIN